jgi:L-lysine exporter family protein LysE/ArgO
VVLVCILADICLILLGVTGMGLAVQQHPGLLQWLRYAGAMFLAAYAVLALWRAWRGESGLQPVSDGAGSRRRVVLACLGFTLLNPHVYLDTVVLLGSLSTQYGGAGRWAFAGGASTASVLWFLSLGYGARVLLPLFRSPVAWRVFDVAVAAFMFALAGLLLLQRVG